MLVQLLIALVILGVVFYLINLIPMDATIRKIIQVVGILIAILLVLRAFGFIDRLSAL